MSLWQIINMNIGFFGIQFSFGLQLSNVSPIHSYTEADQGSLPLYYKTLLGGDPQNAIRLGGALMICAAITTLWVKTQRAETATA